MLLFVKTLLLCAALDLLILTASDGGQDQDLLDQDQDLLDQDQDLLDQDQDILDQDQDFLTFTASDGDQVMLPCGRVPGDQQSCGRTSWFFRSAVGEPEVEVKRLAEGQRAEGRVQVSGCSVVIQRVQQQDVGLYVCRTEEPPTEARVYLSVVFMESNDDVIFYCSVFTFHGCWHSVRWSYSGRSDSRTLDSTCSSRLTMKTPLRSDSGERLHCSVTDQRSGQNLLCDVSSGPSCHRTENSPNPERPTDHNQTYKGGLRLIVVSAGLVVLVVSVVLVNIWTRPSGPERGRHSPSVWDC